MWHDLSTKKITPNQWPDDAIPVRLTRRDRDRQAVSWAKAEQSGHWRAKGTPFKNYRYDFDHIHRLRRTIEIQEERWERFLAQLPTGDIPHLEYESMVADVVGAVSGLAERVGVEAAPRIPEEVRKQAGQINEVWLERYRKESASAWRRGAAFARRLLRSG